MPEKPSRGIDPGVSSYLDLMRVLAAITVVLSHLALDLLGVDVFPGHDAVIVFFVISGYVIAFAAEQRDRTLERFVVNRLARLWSVLIPALLISAVAAIMVGERDKVMFAPVITDPGAFLVGALVNASFLGQNWFFDTPTPFNEPVWSLNYEAWYYAIFAAFTFTPKRWRWGAAALGAVLAGPPIVALMPPWLLGAWLYRRRDRLSLPPGAAYFLFAACILLYVAFYALGINRVCQVWLSSMTGNHSYQLRASTRCIGDMLEACLFAGSIIAVRAMPAVNRGLAASRQLFRAVSSSTFSLYLFHVPVFAIVCGGLGIGRGSTAGAILCIALVFTACVLLATVTEAKLPAWRRVLTGAAAAPLSGAPS